MINLIPFEWLIGIGGVIAALAATWFGGRMAAKSDAKVKEAESYRDTRKAIDDVDQDSIGDDPASLRDWLRERGQSKRPL